MAEPACSFRAVVERLTARGELLRVERPVSPVHELAAVLRAVQRGPNRPLLFTNVEQSPLPVVTNVFARRETVAEALGVAEGQLLRHLVERETRPIPVERVSTGPVREVVVTGELDVAAEIPGIVYAEHDAGGYITGGVLIARHPETGVPNASWNRAQIAGGDKLRVRMMPPQHLGRYHAAAERLGRPIETAIVVGAPPALMLSASSKIPFEADELEVAGAWQRQPLRVVRCETIDVEVPADAELVIEGEVLPYVREEEGPFGEFTDSYVPVMKNHVFRARAITRRRDALYHGILAGGTEDLNVVGVPVQAQVYKHVAQYVPALKDVATPGYIFGCVIAIEKQNEDQPKNALLAALASYSWTKVAVVVDDDVDPFDAADVLWAIQTRCTPDTGIIQVPHVSSYTREDVKEVHRGKVGIDATIPVGLRSLFARRRFPGEEKVDLGSWIPGLIS